MRLTPLEQAVLRLAVSQPEAVGQLREAARGVANLRDGLREVLVWLEERSRSGPPPAAPEIVRRVVRELGAGDPLDVGFLFEESPTEIGEQFREDLVRHLREQALEAELEVVGYEIRGLEQEGDPGGGLASLLQRKLELARALSELRGGGRSGRSQKALD